jgi:hypothetical protein
MGYGYPFHMPQNVIGSAYGGCYGGMSGYGNPYSYPSAGPPNIDYIPRNGPIPGQDGETQGSGEREVRENGTSKQVDADSATTPYHPDIHGPLPTSNHSSYDAVDQRKHYCCICGCQRSNGYHRNHPIIPDQPIMAGICRKCERRTKRYSEADKSRDNEYTELHYPQQEEVEYEWSRGVSPGGTRYRILCQRSSTVDSQRPDSCTKRKEKYTSSTSRGIRDAEETIRIRRYVIPNGDNDQVDTSCNEVTPRKEKPFPIERTLTKKRKSRNNGKLKKRIKPKSIRKIAKEMINEAIQDYRTAERKIKDHPDAFRHIGGVKNKQVPRPAIEDLIGSTDVSTKHISPLDTLQVRKGPLQKHIRPHVSDNTSDEETQISESPRAVSYNYPEKNKPRDLSVPRSILKSPNAQRSTPENIHPPFDRNNKSTEAQQGGHNVSFTPETETIPAGSDLYRGRGPARVSSKQSRVRRRYRHSDDVSGRDSKMNGQESGARLSEYGYYQEPVEHSFGKLHISKVRSPLQRGRSPVRYRERSISPHVRRTPSPTKGATR